VVTAFDKGLVNPPKDSRARSKDVVVLLSEQDVCAIVRTGPGAIHVVRPGDLGPAGTMLVTPGLKSSLIGAKADTE